MLVCQVIGVQAALLVPQRSIEMRRQDGADTARTSSLLLVAMPCLELSGALQGVDVQPIDDPAHSQLASRRHTGAPLGRPVHEIPAGRRFNEPIGIPKA